MSNRETRTALDSVYLAYDRPESSFPAMPNNRRPVSSYYPPDDPSAPSSPNPPASPQLAPGQPARQPIQNAGGYLSRTSAYGRRFQEDEPQQQEQASPPPMPVPILMEPPRSGSRNGDRPRPHHAPPVGQTPPPDSQRGRQRRPTNEQMGARPVFQDQPTRPERQATDPSAARRGPGYPPERSRTQDSLAKHQGDDIFRSPSAGTLKNGAPPPTYSEDGHGRAPPSPGMRNIYPPPSPGFGPSSPLPHSPHSPGFPAPPSPSFAPPGSPAFPPPASPYSPSPNSPFLGTPNTPQGPPSYNFHQAPGSPGADPRIAKWASDVKPAFGQGPIPGEGTQEMRDRKMGHEEKPKVVDEKEAWKRISMTGNGGDPQRERPVTMMTTGETKKQQKGMRIKTVIILFIAFLIFGGGAGGAYYYFTQIAPEQNGSSNVASQGSSSSNTGNSDYVISRDLSESDGSARMVRRHHRHVGMVDGAGLHL